MDLKWIVIIALVWFVYASWKEAKVTNSMIAAARKEDARKERHIARLQNALAMLDMNVLLAVNERCKNEWNEAHRRSDGIIDMTSNAIPKLPPVSDA
ncbi:MAG: hypothetical protein V4723_10750 [Pseudomonadota bacterium]